jgi:hypothetical protein
MLLTSFKYKDASVIRTYACKKAIANSRQVIANTNTVGINIAKIGIIQIETHCHQNLFSPPR